RPAVLWAAKAGHPHPEDIAPGLLTIGVPEVVNAVDKQLRKRPWPGTGLDRRAQQAYRRVG
ncbi:glycosyltransferase family 9 protein, partial [Nocardia tengchongensis]